MARKTRKSDTTTKRKKGEEDNIDGFTGQVEEGVMKKRYKGKNAIALEYIIDDVDRQNHFSKHVKSLLRHAKEMETRTGCKILVIVRAPKFKGESRTHVFCSHSHSVTATLEELAHREEHSKQLEESAVEGLKLIIKDFEKKLDQLSTKSQDAQYIKDCLQREVKLCKKEMQDRIDAFGLDMQPSQSKPNRRKKSTSASPPPSMLNRYTINPQMEAPAPMEIFPSPPPMHNTMYTINPQMEAPAPTAIYPACNVILNRIYLFIYLFIAKNIVTS